MDLAKIMQGLLLVLITALATALGMQPIATKGSAVSQAVFREQIRTDISSEMEKALLLQKERLSFLLRVHQLEGHRKVEPSRYIEKLPGQ